MFTSRFANWLTASGSGIIARNSEQSSLARCWSFLGCYRLNGSSLRSTPCDLLHRIALSPSTTHRRRRRGNVGYTIVGKTQRKRKRDEEQERKREDERENESGERDRATKMEGRLYGAAKGKESLSDESRHVGANYSRYTLYRYRDFGE